MDATCPKCGGEMGERTAGEVTVRTCGSCQGIFLDRADLGRLVEAENDWHSQRSADTAQLPMITADTKPPRPSKARSYLDSLFGA
jgi:Zn-finger nucleic acid-binding protein